MLTLIIILYAESKFVQHPCKLDKTCLLKYLNKKLHKIIIHNCAIEHIILKKLIIIIIGVGPEDSEQKLSQGAVNLVIFGQASFHLLEPAVNTVFCRLYYNLVIYLIFERCIVILVCWPLGDRINSVLCFVIYITDVKTLASAGS